MLFRSQTIFASTQPILAQAIDTIQKLKAQGPQDPNVAALVQTQMAETQRKAAKDQMDGKLKAADMQRLAQESEKDLQTRVLMNTEDNLTAERIKSAELTNDAARLQHEQVQTAIDAQNALQTNLGGQNV